MYHQKRGDTYTHCWIYANNILVASQSIEQHKVFVFFFKDSFDFLAFKLTLEGVQVSDEKAEAVRQYARPTDIQSVQRYVGFTNFLSRFVPNYEELAVPLTDICRKGRKFEWTDKQQNAFEAIKKTIVRRITLSIFNSSIEIHIFCDASSIFIPTAPQTVKQNKGDEIYKDNRENKESSG